MHIVSMAFSKYFSHKGKCLDKYTIFEALKKFYENMPSSFHLVNE